MKVRFPPGVPLTLLLSGLGGVFTLVLAGIALNGAIDYENDRFGTDAAAIYDNLGDRINALGEVATSLSCLVNSTTYVDADQFRIFAEAIQSRHPYLVCAAYLPLITSRERDSFEKERRERGFITFEIRNRSAGSGFQRTPERKRYFPIVYLEPFEPGTAALIGLDVLGEQEYARAARRAIVTGEISPAPDGSRDFGRTGNFLFVPVYGGKNQPANPEGREAMITGLIGLGFFPQAMLKDAIEDGGKRAATTARWRILDQQGLEMVGAGYSGPQPEASGLMPLVLTRSYSKKFYGNAYELVISRPLLWKAIDYTNVFLMVLAGSVITLLMLVAGRQVSCRARELEARNREIERQVAEKTAALSESNRLLRLEMEERRRVENELLHTQKMEAIGRLAGGIAHDFNNLLAAIIGYAELAATEADRKSLQADLDQILAASHRAKQVVQQILQFSRRAPEERSPLLLGPVVEEALSLLRASLPAGIEIEKDIREDCGPVLANPTQIHQVMINLGTNAGYAMQDKGGKLRVELGMAANGYARLSVFDSGCGMEAEVAEHVFEPYFTTRKIGEGSGMGLAVVHGIVQAHGGLIEVESTPGCGSAFHVFLPCTGSGGQAGPDSSAAEPVPGGSESILLVDDEPGVNASMQRILTGLGYKVAATTSSHQALELFRSGQTDFHLVLTDQAMPKMSGTELARRLRKLRPDIPIILCTGYSTFIHEGNLQQFGLQALVMKPSTREDLGRLIRRVLDNAAAGSLPAA